MPASVYVSFDAPEGVPATPRRLHAALSAVLDLPPGISPARADQKPHQPRESQEYLKANIQKRAPQHRELHTQAINCETNPITKPKREVPQCQNKSTSKRAIRLFNNA